MALMMCYNGDHFLGIGQMGVTVEQLRLLGITVEALA